MRTGLLVAVLVPVAVAVGIGGTVLLYERDAAPDADGCAEVEAQALEYVKEGTRLHDTAINARPTVGGPPELAGSRVQEAIRLQRATGVEKARIGYRLVVNHPECFPAEAVAAAQEKLG